MPGEGEGEGGGVDRGTDGERKSDALAQSRFVKFGGVDRNWP